MFCVKLTIKSLTVQTKRARIVYKVWENFIRNHSWNLLFQNGVQNFQFPKEFDTDTTNIIYKTLYLYAQSMKQLPI